MYLIRAKSVYYLCDMDNHIVHAFSSYTGTFMRSSVDKSHKLTGADMKAISLGTAYPVVVDAYVETLGRGITDRKCVQGGSGERDRFIKTLTHVYQGKGARGKVVMNVYSVREK